MKSLIKICCLFVCLFGATTHAFSPGLSWQREKVSGVDYYWVSRQNQNRSLSLQSASIQIDEAKKATEEEFKSNILTGKVAVLSFAGIKDYKINYVRKTFNANSTQFEVHGQYKDRRGFIVYFVEMHLFKAEKSQLLKLSDFKVISETDIKQFIKWVSDI